MWADRHGSFKCHGYIEYRAETGPNTVVGEGYGPMIVEFKDGIKIEIWGAKTEIKGLMYGERTFKLTGTMLVKDHKNKLYAEICFDIDKKSGLASIFSKAPTNHQADYFEGCISH